MGILLNRIFPTSSTILFNKHKTVHLLSQSTPTLLLSSSLPSKAHLTTLQQVRCLFFFSFLFIFFFPSFFFFHFLLIWYLFDFSNHPRRCPFFPPVLLTPIASLFFFFTFSFFFLPFNVILFFTTWLLLPSLHWKSLLLLWDLPPYHSPPTHNAA